MGGRWLGWLPEQVSKSGADPLARGLLGGDLGPGLAGYLELGGGHGWNISPAWQHRGPTMGLR
jgi:hypothetical protein